MARDAARKARDDARKSTGTKKEKNISDKLAPAARHDNSKNELFIERVIQLVDLLNQVEIEHIKQYFL